MDWFCQTYMDVVLEHLGIPNDDEHRDEIDDALVEGLGLISTELSDIVSDVQIEELSDKLEKFGFIDGYHKSLFIHKMNKCLSNPSANEYDCLESVIDDCYKT